ncbi:hypothetical protein BCT00_01055 [Vibrio breoganii]|nr:hypothetical protein BCT00_01055 [Vibrio breoganii]
MLTASGLVYSLIQWLVFIYLSWQHTADEVSYYAYILAFIGPGIMLANFGVRSLITTSEDKSVDVTLIFIRVCLLVVVSIGLISYFYTYNPDYIFIVVFLFLFKASDSFADGVYGIFQKIEKYELIFLSRIIRSFMYLLVLVLGYTFDFTLNLLVMLLAFSSLLISLLFEVRYSVKYYKIFSEGFSCFSKMKKVIYSGIALSATLYLNSMLINYPRISVEKYIGLEDLKIFVSIGYMFVFSDAIFQAINSISLRRLSIIDGKRGGLHFKFFSLNILLILFIFGFVALFGSTILSVLYKADFDNYSYLIQVTTLAFLLNNLASSIGCILTAMKKNVIQPFITFGTFMFLLILMAISEIEVLSDIAEVFLLAIICKLILVSAYYFSGLRAKG